jgi:hypothetical protein
MGDKFAFFNRQTERRYFSIDNSTSNANNTTQHAMNPLDQRYGYRVSVHTNNNNDDTNHADATAAEAYQRCKEFIVNPFVAFSLISIFCFTIAVYYLVLAPHKVCNQSGNLEILGLQALDGLTCAQTALTCPPSKYSFECRYFYEGYECTQDESFLDAYRKYKCECPPLELDG